MPLTSKEKFLKVYANLPLNLRNEIILTLDNRPITWDVAFFEIDNDTPAGKTILAKLEKLELI
ncbi:MAG: hypothetical protein PHW01_00285 [Patescibacteria group bacterium]|nr:hypothetical protein [Patescibacteria group bacterium]